VDPGNFATNMAGGSRFGYMLLWVVLAANLMAMLIQSMSAKLGIATGLNLPEVCRDRFPRPVVWFLWIQAELIARATDPAELDGPESIVLATGILGATVMPHVIYLHSALTQKRVVGANPEAKRKIFHFEMADVVIAMGIAGVINLAMLTTAAAVFNSRGLISVGTDLGQVFNG